MKTIGRILLAVIAVAGALLLMLGQFWVLYLAPMLIFIGVAVVYGYLSSKPLSKGQNPRQLSAHDSDS
jgi:flagellar motor component MotA